MYHHINLPRNLCHFFSSSSCYRYRQYFFVATVHGIFALLFVNLITNMKYS